MKMVETVVVRQGRDRITSYRAGAAEQGAAVLRDVQYIGELTPYGMVLAGFGACTALVVNTYAEHRGLPVEAVAVTLEYRRSFASDCEHCAEPDLPEEQILMTVAMEGPLSPEQREKLVAIARHCPVHQMLTGGVTVAVTPP
jgi:putative redox protein